MAEVAPFYAPYQCWRDCQWDAPYATIHVLPSSVSHSSNLVIPQGYKGTDRLSCRFIYILASNLLHTHHASPNKIHLLYLYSHPGCVAYPWRSIEWWSVLRHDMLLVIAKWILNVRNSEGSSTFRAKYLIRTWSDLIFRVRAYCIK
jgi:hypothetical protein